MKCFNNTVRQRVSRIVRRTLSFPKKLRITQVQYYFLNSLSALHTRYDTPARSRFPAFLASNPGKILCIPFILARRTVRGRSFVFENEAPLFPDDENLDAASPSKALRMVGGIELYIPDGGPHGLDGRENR